jgi:hypothetical protein
MVIDSPPRPPSRDEPDALIPEARDRQRRRRLLGAAGIAIAAAVGVGLFALLGGSKPGNPPSPTASGGRVAVTICRSSQLAASVILSGALGLGGASGSATISNGSGTTCSLPASAPAIQISYRGTPRPLHETVLQPPNHRSVRLLRPGQKAEIWLVWQNWCASPHHPISQGGYPLRQPQVVFRFRLGHGLTITVPYVGAVTCLAPGSASSLMASRPVNA